MGAPGGLWVKVRVVKHGIKTSEQSIRSLHLVTDSNLQRGNWHDGIEFSYVAEV